MLRSFRFCVLFCILLSSSLHAKTLSIFHSNDEHSRFLGFAPDSEYKPDIKGDGTVGGVARLATLLNERRELAKTKGPVITLESGDYSMGTLFSMITREKAPELQFLKLLEYDAITFGNHEFDFGVKGLVQMIESALREIGTLPPIVATNLVLTENNPQDEGLRKFVRDGVIKPYVVIEKQDLRIGILGILGKDAIEVSMNHSPVSFSEPVSTVRKYVDILRNKEKVDAVILLSHGGVYRDVPDWKGTEWVDVGDDGKWYGEDLDLAKEVPGIDVIISGHTHTPLVHPLKVGHTYIVQAGAEMRYLGELELELQKKHWEQHSYKLHPINDSILGDSKITEKVNSFKTYIDKEMLGEFHIQFDQPTSKIRKDITRDYTDNALGHLLSSAFKKTSGADIGFCPDGVIRDDIFAGKTGIQSFSDIFRLLPLGMGEVDEKIGYPMIKVFVNGRELKQVLETLLIAYKLKGSNYHPRLAGLHLTYNPYRMPLDRVVEASLVKEDGKLESIDFKNEKRLYSLGTISYVGKFFWVIPEVSFGLFNVTPKSANGEVIHDIKEAIVNLHPELPGTHEYKGWHALLDYIQALPRDPVSQLPLIPTEGSVVETPILNLASFFPGPLFQNATWIQWVGSGFSVIILLLILFSVRYMSKRWIKKY